MNGLIIINKEKNMTSHDVVSRARKILKTKRIGHTGTLDPNATGVLVLCVDEGTKLVPYLEQDSKTYYAEVILGLETDTYDITGNIVKEEHRDFSVDEINEVLKSFVGTYNQLPPIYSSIKVNGKKLYQYARNNEKVEIQPRPVKINFIFWNNEIYDYNGYKSIKIEVDVSKGTYIRSLCHDIGEKLNCCACMGELERTRSGKFHIEQAVTLEDLENGNYKVVEMLNALNYPVINIDNDELLKIVNNGMKIKSYIVESILKSKPVLITFVVDNRLKAIYELENEIYKVSRVWM